MRDFVGTTFEHEWTEGAYTGVIYRVEFISDTMLRWTGIAGFAKGRSDIQKYTLQKINDTISQFSWLANDGLSVIITYNFVTMRSFGVISTKTEQHVLRGSLRKLNSQ
ncbi:TPA: hypothetical protein HA278_02210 [Candidatus Woesearchaeota archaeon]|nr:hypothetical protein [archaeon]HIJ10849.1 hypothetical protein [Candidatus Woesearchaeota archaeon]|tara:strand:- start:337 stop:660 length:324 start_codon:yes stop_codon:yes gene_type:complete